MRERIRKVGRREEEGRRGGIGDGGVKWGRGGVIRGE